MILLVIRYPVLSIDKNKNACFPAHIDNICLKPDIFMPYLPLWMNICGQHGYG